MEKIIGIITSTTRLLLTIIRNHQNIQQNNDNQFV